MPHLKDYTPPHYEIIQADLCFDLFEDQVEVASTLQLKRRESAPTKGSLLLHGEELCLQEITLDGRPLKAGESGESGESADYQLTAEGLVLHAPPEQFILFTKVFIKPQENSTLSGLYRSEGLFCTQCEPEGFRRITYFLDRPDVMTRFSVEIRAEIARYPVLLSNGNCVGNGLLDEGRHWVRWEDPHKKPAYLFALVAGDLAALEDHFVTASGRLVTLKIYADRRNQDKCGHAMKALKKAMQWDERAYGREYDLDIYMIVAVNDFNSGAMENKGLNIFNAKYVLASPETATDDDLESIDAVIAHEYFHNWTGNRITCRDWFQLSLKEGLTVFREQQFMEEQGVLAAQDPLDQTQAAAAAVQRIDAVRFLETRQFEEDAGPMAHPVRPESYIEINNFYTATVYEKGAEVIRMLKILLGQKAFRQGMDLYFERHDGQAVTTDDFVEAMQAVSNKDLTDFKLWYTQAGTPEITLKGNYDAVAGSYRLMVEQSCPPTPGQTEKKAMVMPLAVGLLDSKGNEWMPTIVVELKKERETFEFSLPFSASRQDDPVPSLFRGFSAPVKIKNDLSDKQLAVLLAKDNDAFCRWNAGQQLTQRLLQQGIAQLKTGGELALGDLGQIWLEAQKTCLNDKSLAPALKAECLSLPSLSYLLDLFPNTAVAILYQARFFLKEQFVASTHLDLEKIYHENKSSPPYAYDAVLAGRRRLKNLCLSYLASAQVSGQEKQAITYRTYCKEQWIRADNMTDRWGALMALNHTACEERESLLTAFYDRWGRDPLLIGKWFMAQAVSELSGTFNVVERLTQHPDFSFFTPNHIYALVGSFCSSNPLRFHDPSGVPYHFLSDVVVRLDKTNPQLAARIASPFTQWRRLEEEQQKKMREQVEQLYRLPKLSKHLYEVVSKSLA